MHREFSLPYLHEQEDFNVHIDDVESVLNTRAFQEKTTNKSWYASCRHIALAINHKSFMQNPGCLSMDRTLNELSVVRASRLWMGPYMFPSLSSQRVRRNYARS